MQIVGPQAAVLDEGDGAGSSRLDRAGDEVHGPSRRRPRRRRVRPPGRARAAGAPRPAASLAIELGKPCQREGGGAIDLGVQAPVERAQGEGGEVQPFRAAPEPDHGRACDAASRRRASSRSPLGVGEQSSISRQPTRALDQRRAGPPAPHADVRTSAGARAAMRRGVFEPRYHRPARAWFARARRAGRVGSSSDRAVPRRARPVSDRGSNRACAEASCCFAVVLARTRMVPAPCRPGAGRSSTRPMRMPTTYILGMIDDAEQIAEHRAGGGAQAFVADAHLGVALPGRGARHHFRSGW